jgi:heme/copper-type cytochrome/quinol oxidase subunit 2
MPEQTNKTERGGVKLGLRIAAFAVIVLAVMGAAAWLLQSSLMPSPLIEKSNSSVQNGNVVTLEADMSGFSMNEIHAKLGEPLTVRLISLDKPYHMDGGGKHQFAIDELSVNIVAPSEGMSEMTFTPNKSGVYEFYCDICCGGRANPAMQGQLIVSS